MTKRNVVHIEIPTRNHEESIRYYKELIEDRYQVFIDGL